MKIQYPEVVVFGEALIDRLGPMGGDPLYDEGCEDCFGGAPANVACSLAKLGTGSAFIGRLGNDLYGNNFRELMGIRGVDLQCLQIDDYSPTRIVLVRRDLNGERNFHGFAGDKGDGFADQAIDLNELKSSWNAINKKVKWLVIGTIPLAFDDSAESLEWLLNESMKQDIYIAIDLNWRPIFWDPNSEASSGPDDIAFRRISNILTKSNLIKLSKEEAIWFFNTNEPDKISNSLPQGPDVVVTDGASKVRWFINSFLGEIPSFSNIEVVDTTGAGDAFTAGLIHKIIMSSLQLNDPIKVQEIIRFASACGALVCGGAGAITPQPSCKDVDNFISSNSGL